MKRTDTLIRLERFRVDEMQRRMDSIAAMKTEIERKLTDMENDVTRQRERTGNSYMRDLAYPAFLRSIEMRRENLRMTLKEIEREYAVVQVDLSNTIQGLKSLEATNEQQVGRHLDKIVRFKHRRK